MEPHSSEPGNDCGEKDSWEETLKVVCCVKALCRCGEKAAM